MPSNKVAVYTSIFGGYDNLIEDHYSLDGIDFLCFTDSKFNSNTWNVIDSVPIYKDPNRNAKKYKVLPHRYLQNYDWSIWIDGNIKIVGNVLELLNNDYYQLYDHMKVFDKRNCIYEEAEAILNFGKINSQKNPEKGIRNWKDDPNLIIKQMNRYREEGYPKDNGLATTPIIIRRHNDDEVIEFNEKWWSEIKYNSKRDQLSFNYIAWKLNFNYSYLEGDSRNNSYFKNIAKHVKK